MPSYCAVVNCNSNAAKTDEISFFRFPSVIGKNRKVCPLRVERRDKWIAAVHRNNFTTEKAKYSRICSRHFHSGKPSDLHDKDHPDWVPSLHMGYQKTGTTRNLHRYERLKKRLVTETDETIPVSSSRTHCEATQEDGSKIPDNKEPTYEDMSLALRNANERIYNLETKLSHYKLNESYLKQNNDKVLYYTGFPKYEYVENIFKLVEVYMSENSVLSKFQQLLLTLIKLRLNLQFTDLGHRFLCHRTTASRIFEQVLNILYCRFHNIIIWPSREELQLNMPASFQRVFKNKTTVIIDCFEIFVQKPSNLEAAAKMWSNYKHHHTMKFLIAISPQGTISFISNAYGGRASDKFIAEDCGFLNNLIKGDLVLADRGFSIDHSVEIYCAEVKYPTFLKGKKQLAAIDTEATRKLASVKIHVERVIGLLKKKFRILTEEFPISSLKKSNQEIALIDQIVVVCSAFINLCPSIVPIE